MAKRTESVAPGGKRDGAGAAASSATAAVAAAAAAAPPPPQRQGQDQAQHGVEPIWQQLLSVLGRVLFMYVMYSLVMSKESPVMGMVNKFISARAGGAATGHVAVAPNADGSELGLVNASAGERQAQPAAAIDAAAMMQNYLESMTGQAALKKAIPPDRYLLRKDVALSNMWSALQKFDVRVYLSDSQEMDAVALVAATPIWKQIGVEYNWNSNPSTENGQEIRLNVSLPDSVVLQNSSYYIHSLLSVEGAIQEEDGQGSVARILAPRETWPDAFLMASLSLVRWRTVDLSKKGKQLLSSAPRNEDTSQAQSEIESVPSRAIDDDTKNQAEECLVEDAAGGISENTACTVPPSGVIPPAAGAVVGDAIEESRTGIIIEQVWKPEVLLTLLVDHAVFRQGSFNQVSPMVQGLYKASADKQHYLPPFFVNEFWLLDDQLIPINASYREVPLSVAYNPIGMLKLAFLVQMEAVWETQKEMGLQEGGGVDDIKRMLVETNPYLLGVTVVVSIAHSILEMLAFSSDIKHWKNTKSMAGISVRSMFWNFGMQVVIFLYLMDSETSFMILAGQAVGLAIELWKIGKAVKVKSFGKRKLFGILPWFELEESASYLNETKEYDDMAMRYLSYLIYPLVIAYSVYSLVYKEHRGWYSWLISSLVGAVYAFGFIMMFPQIFINYKLKSVAHLPLKAFMYKALNTFIDDLFSFIIKMPTMHRLACFRDDIVFVIFLYQRYIYPVDKKRVNEFGQGGVEDETASASSSAVAPLSVSTPLKRKKKSVRAASAAAPEADLAAPSHVPSKDSKKQDKTDRPVAGVQTSSAAPAAATSGL
ncbi:CLPTM1-like membrane protein cnrB [Porphyridium purpureum]|uniref:CLPTM1-like membrane protein cnrB n=1 Tax=Porphyridium purpureum TaxID=35688 RepID=A0A5J4YXD3_PORPP|nr:CLPTM1-like membrane protein cnrB [Porphyridium purpureum]|eukprot:POR8873..scf209_3